MSGPVLIVITLVFVVPVAVMVGGMIWSALLGLLLVQDAEQRAEGRPT